MYLEFIIDGKAVYYQVPDFHLVLGTNPPPHSQKAKGTEYSRLIADASIIASANEVAKSVANGRARDAIHSGGKAAVQALQKSAGKNVTIKE